MRVTRIVPHDRHAERDDDDGDNDRDGDDEGITVLGRDLDVLPNNHGPQTDRLVYGLGPFSGYNRGDPTSREQGLYDQSFVDGFIHDLSNGGRIIAGQFDDPYQLDEKGIFDLVNLGSGDLGGIAGARRGAVEDVFTGFNVFSIALEVPMTDIFPNGIPHNGALDAELHQQPHSRMESRSAAAASRPWTRTTSSPASGLRPFVQVGRNALPLFNAGLVGTQRQTLYLRSSPLKDVTNFGADVLFPVLVRDAEALGIYAALGVPPATVTTLKGPRTGHHQGDQPGSADSDRRRFHWRCASRWTWPSIRVSQRPTPWRRHRAEPQPGQRQQRPHQPDRRRRPERGSGEGRRSQRQELPRPLPVPGARPPGTLQGHGGINVPTDPTPPPPPGP